MNIEDSQRLVEIDLRIEQLALLAEEHPAIEMLLRSIGSDFSWLIERLDGLEREKNGYREELDLILQGTHQDH